jgi:hypothetical protein
MKLSTYACSLTMALITSSLYAETKPAPVAHAKATVVKPGVAASPGARPAPTLGNLIVHPIQTLRGLMPAPSVNARPPTTIPARALTQTRAPIVRPMGISQRIAGCAGKAGGPCAVWRSFGSAPDQAQLFAARQQAFRQGSFSTHWVGADGVRREIWVSAGPTQMVNVVIPVVAVSAATVALAAARAAYYPPPPTAIVAVSSAPTAVPSALLTDTGASPGMPVNPDATPAAAAVPPGEAATAPQSAAPAAGGPSPADSGAASAPAPVSMGPPQKRVCRQVNTRAMASGHQDSDMTLYCRNDEGDWVEATRLVASN